jgi:alpha/beta superfamily hydrolase
MGKFLPQSKVVLTMEEEKVFFGPEDVRLEGLYANSGGAVGAVISHPHPLRGGDMSNPIVDIMADALFAVGISTLRFNFRGVGKSSGTHDAGRGEQDDVLAAISFMEEQGRREIMLAGYSFGAWVSAGILNRRNLLPAVFVSPPVSLLGFDFTTLRGKVGIIICGDRDKYCPTDRIKIVAAELACRLDIIPDADHFYQSRENDFAACIKDYLATYN